MSLACQKKKYSTLDLFPAWLFRVGVIDQLGVGGGSGARTPASARFLRMNYLKDGFMSASYKEKLRVALDFIEPY